MPVNKDEGSCYDPEGYPPLCRPVGERSVCKDCDQDIEWTGDDWRDRGGNRECVVTQRPDGGFKYAQEGQTHAP